MRSVGEQAPPGAEKREKDAREDFADWGPQDLPSESLALGCGSRQCSATTFWRGPGPPEIQVARQLGHWPFAN